jgi:hypothetical protein
LSSPETSPQNETESRFRSRIRIVAVASLATILAVRIILPYALEWALPRIAASQNLHAEVGNIDLGLVVGEITLENLIVDFPRSRDGDVTSQEPPPPGDSQPLLALDRIYVAFEWTDLLFRRLHITDLELSHPTVEITQLADGRFELPFAADEEGPEVAEPGTALESPSTEAANETETEAAVEPGWEFRLDRFELNNPDVALRSEATREEVVHFAADQLGFDALFVGPDGIGLGDIDIEHPELFVQREWLLGLNQAPATPESEAEPEALDAPPAELPSVRLKHLNIERAAFTVRTREGPVAVALRLRLTDAGTAPGHTFPFELGLEVDDAKVEIDGRLGLNPTSFAGQLQWQNLSVPPFLLLAYPDLVPWLASCDADGDLQIVFRSVSDTEPAGLTASGSTSIDALSFKHPESGELALEWDALDIDIRKAFVPLEPTPERPIRMDLTRVSLTAPRIQYTNPPDALDELLAALAKDSAALEDPEAEPDEEAPNEPGIPPTILISQLELNDGTLRFVDRSVKPVHETKIQKLRIRVDALTTAPAVGAKEVSADGLIQSTGSFKLRGALPGGQGELDFALEQLDLVSYDSLAGAAGWQIESGSTSLDSTIIASGDSYKTNNKLVLHGLDVASKNESEFSSRFGMPLDLALALLRDASGDISITAPVTLDAEGGGVDLGPIVLSALRSALQGALTSPLKMLGMLVPKGAGADSLGALPFAPGEDEPGPDARAQLASLAAFLESRPRLGLSFDGHWSTDDRTPTARKILRELANSGGDLPEIDGASLFARRRVATALRGDDAAEDELSPEDKELLEKYVAAQEVSQARFRALAEMRAQSLRSTLLELGAHAEALSIGSPSPSDQPSVTIDLQSRPEPIAAQSAPEN